MIGGRSAPQVPEFIPGARDWITLYEAYKDKGFEKAVKKLAEAHAQAREMVALVGKAEDIGTMRDQAQAALTEAENVRAGAQANADAILDDAARKSEEVRVAVQKRIDEAKAAADAREAELTKREDDLYAREQESVGDIQRRAEAVEELEAASANNMAEADRNLERAAKALESAKAREADINARLAKLREIAA